MCRAATVRAASSAELSLSLRSPRAPGVRSSAGSARGAHRPQLLNRVQHVALLLQTDEPRGEVVDLRCRRERREDVFNASKYSHSSSEFGMLQALLDAPLQS